MYASFAGFYDSLTADVDYVRRADYFSRVFSRHGARQGGVLLDLGCGTGSLTLPLAALGWELISVDISEEMLAAAAAKAAGLPPKGRPIFLCQDISALDLYGMADAALCALDTINHLTTRKALSQLFMRLSLFLETGGLFVFDANTPHKHQNILSGETFVYETPDLFCIWQNSECHANTVDIRLDFFHKTGENSYRRQVEQFSERAFTTEEFLAAAEPFGFVLKAVYDEDSFSPPGEKSQRLIYVMENTTAHRA